MLRVLAAHGEGRRCTDAAVEGLARELTVLAQWLGLEGMATGERGDICSRLSDRLGLTPANG